MAEQEEDYSLLPFSDRFQHKAWKVRKAAYEDAMKQFETTPDESDPVFRSFNQDPALWKGAVADTNVAAQQSGISALCAFLKFGSKENCVRSRSFTISSLVEKGLASTKANTKASSIEAILLYIELDVAAPIIEDMLPSLSNKQPKVVAATLGALTIIYHNYGCKVVDPKPSLKILPKAFGHADKNVRAEATNLATELFRWLREAMKPVFWGDLKATQQADMDTHFERVKLEPTPKQERYLRSQQALIAQTVIASDSGEVDLEEDNDEQEIDVFSMLEPQEVLSKIPSDFNEQVVSTKWKDRKDVLELVYNVLNIPKLKDGDYSELVRAFAKCMKDPNIAVVVQAAQCIEALAKGLKTPFGRYRSIVSGPMIEKLKEKKASVSDALGAALDQVFLATNLTENLEEILENLKHKNPQVKEGTLKFLIRCLKTTREAPSKQEVVSISDAAKKLLTESSESLRSGGAEVLGTVMKIMGERAMGPHLECLDDIRKTKVKEYFDAAEVKAKDKPKKPPVAVANRVPPTSVTRKNIVKKPTVRKPASAQPSVYAQESNQVPQTAAKSTTGSKVGITKTSGLVTPSLKAPTKRAIAGAGGPSSPRRPNSQITQTEDEIAPAPRAGPTRGLAGRSLVAKLPGPISIPPSSFSPPPSSGLLNSEKSELEELRLDNVRLLRQNDELRQERARLNSEIHELKNETAKLIEDRARDSLSNIAKETQLVRARSDFETADAMCGQLRREMERLKRALASAERVNHSARMSPTRSRIGDETVTHNIPGTNRNYSDNRQSFDRSRISYTPVQGEEKENGDRLSASYLNKVIPDNGSNGRTSAAGGRNSPLPLTSFKSSRFSREIGVDNHRPEVGQELESWKRAAEVTRTLKEKIELMKARQGIP